MREKIKPITKIKYIGSGWVVEFWIGNQGFTLRNIKTKAGATWMKKMLDKAFKNLK